MANSTVTKIVCIIFMIIGLGFLLGAIYSYKTIEDFQENSISVKGTVISLSASRNKGGSLYKPVVEYSYNNQSFQIIGSVSSRPPAYEIGENVDVMLKINNPSEAIIDSFFERWFFAALFAGLGAVFTLIGVGMLFFNR